MKWTTVADVKAQLERRWTRGDICRAAVADSELFPFRIAFKLPAAKVMLDAFGDMQDWVKLIRNFADKHTLKLEWQEIKHRNLGRQQLPIALLLSTPEQAAALIGRRQALQQFCRIYRATQARLPELLTWLLKRPVKALELEQAWFQLVDLCVWMQAHPNPRIYLRQVSVAGIDSKFIESQRQVLAELFDLVIPVYAINDDFSGVAGFARRYGFRDKPLMVRLRPLDQSTRLLYSDGNQDISITAAAFSTLRPDVRRIFITENEINYLAFPDMPQSLIIFGAGYGFDALEKAVWLADCEIYYWGDIDTHGFAILDQLRAHFPHTQSLLMDRNTLMAHRPLWGKEPAQERRELVRLTAAETALYHDLRTNMLDEQLRLEQERIAFSHLQKAVNALLL